MWNVNRNTRNQLIVEIWVMLKTRYDENCYNDWRLTQIQQKYSHVTSTTNEAEMTLGLWSAYSERKVSKNQDETLKIEYCTNLAYALEEAGKGPSATHMRNKKIREEDCTLYIQIRYSKENAGNQVLPLSLKNKSTAVHCK